jgi:hypothetical protein
MAVVTDGIEGEGAVMFKGWLGPIDAAHAPGAQPAPADAQPAPADAAGPVVGADNFRFFTDPQFLEWLELSRDDILYQTIAASDDPEGGSVIWVKREARIRRCQAGRAYWFEQLMADTADDPTARHPRPPQ